MKKNKKICVAASAGGHLTEVLQLSEVWRGKEYFFISDKRINAIDLSKKEKVFFITPPRRSVLKTIIAFIQSLKIFLKEKPDIIISTGAEIGFPPLILGWLLGKKTIYIESLTRINSPSLCGKLVYGKVTHFFVQWEEGLEFFPKAKYFGSVF